MLPQARLKINPILLAGEGEFIQDFEECVDGARLFPLGEVDQDGDYLLVDELGRAYIIHCGGMESYHSVEELVKSLILGIRGKEVDLKL